MQADTIPHVITWTYSHMHAPLNRSCRSVESCLQVAKATLSDETAMLDTFDGAEQNGRHNHGSIADPFEGSTRDKFLVAAAAAPRFLLLDFRQVLVKLFRIACLYYGTLRLSWALVILLL